eukprot:TRINITY_DN61157_c0_g1_i1.p1 TRINITY_DN61157_c0_g1~~TRINITY_DN61157_c0_g1_i1.p1  ORF type:complete len:133 (-),score=28.60 TRINITY_DN61157_c0_g1_i1:223-621(-)
MGTEADRSFWRSLRREDFFQGASFSEAAPFEDDFKTVAWNAIEEAQQRFVDDDPQSWGEVSRHETNVITALLRKVVAALTSHCAERRLVFFGSLGRDAGSDFRASPNFAKFEHVAEFGDGSFILLMAVPSSS